MTGGASLRGGALPLGPEGVEVISNIRGQKPTLVIAGAKEALVLSLSLAVSPPAISFRKKAALYPSPAGTLGAVLKSSTA